MGICGLCGDRWGSTEHNLLYCPKVIQIWKGSRFWDVVKRANGLELLQVAEAIWTEWGAVDYEFWALMLWQTWALVCKLLHPGDGGVDLPSESSCMAMWDAYQAAKPTFAEIDKLGVALGEKVWRRPQRGCCRVDVDASFSPETRSFGVGVVVRDAEGRLLAALAKKTAPSSSVMMSEIMAVVHGIVLCVEKGFAPVELYTDSFLAARVMADPEEEDLLLPDDIRDIIHTARENFLLGVFHMFRSANLAAHSLAHFAASLSQSKCWTASFPSWLKDIVSHDIS